MTSRRLAVLSSGLSTPSSTRLLADRLTAVTVDALSERGVPAEVDRIELRELGHALVDQAVTGFGAPALREAFEATQRADGLIAVTPVYSASYTGLFKLFFDGLDREVLAGKPTLIAATGGTARHSLALEHAVRPLFAHLRATVVPTAVFAAPEDWGGGEALDRRIARAATELADLIAARPASTPTDPFSTPTPFEQLLSGA
ncbi:MAG TPA: FMN reductase [Pseudonocardia sp.]|nr:FMN reductase [Pseudonocardia sp.]